MIFKLICYYLYIGINPIYEPIGVKTLRAETYVVKVAEAPILLVLKDLLIPDTVVLRVFIDVFKLKTEVESVVEFKVKELILVPIVVILLFITVLESPKQSVPAIAVKEIKVFVIRVAIVIVVLLPVYLQVHHLYLTVFVCILQKIIALSLLL